ncbi:MAG: putative acyl-CoA thioester hydrolase [Phycisphaerae bacterium]|nr:putative acyl-CoA thioester hydrolase [Phycisphaerae bacterium]
MDDSRIKPPSNEPAIRVVMMPRDANPQGTVFGGVILSYLDQAGFIECVRQSYRRYVTVAMDQVEFLEPVLIGDIVSYYANTTQVGRTSIKVHVKVRAEHRTSGEWGRSVLVTEADMTFVAVDEHRRPIPVWDDPAGGWCI